MARSSLTNLWAAVAAAWLLFAADSGWLLPSSPRDGSFSPRRQLALPDLTDVPKPYVIKTPPTITETEIFPYHHTISDRCIKRETIVEVSRLVRGILEQGIRVFPRNGFLLGIVRHGGFLPNEHVDPDLGIVSSDVEKAGWYRPSKEGFIARVHGFGLQLNRFEDGYWQNWKGINPASGELYPFMGANINEKRVNVHLRANPVYPYRDTGAFFFPWLTTSSNHEASLADGIRYNNEGGDLRLIDTDERLDANNYREEAQLGNVFDTDLLCFKEVQFYFTTIPIPCDYDKILTSLYGKNWHHVENRGDIGEIEEWRETHFSAHAVSDQDNEQLLRGGPRPICILNDLELLSMENATSNDLEPTMENADSFFTS